MSKYSGRGHCRLYRDYFRDPLPYSVSSISKIHSWGIVPLKWIEHGVYGMGIIRYPKPYSIYLRGTIGKICSWSMIMHGGQQHVSSIAVLFWL